MMRKINFDLIRVVAMVLVIAAHTNPKPFPNNTLKSCIFYAVVYMCNGLFFMLSGNLNLRKKFATVTDYLEFYANKIITLVFPFFLGSAALTIYKYEGEFRLDWMIKSIIADFMGGHNGTYLWFVYSLIGMVLSTPFLAKMLQAMSDKELIFLWNMGMLWQVASVYLAANLGLSFGFGNWILPSWSYYYYSGYFVERIVNYQERNKCYIGAVIGFIITVCGTYFWGEQYKYANDLAPAYVCLVIGVYAFLYHMDGIKSNTLKKVIEIVSRHSFTVYLVHHIVKRELEKISIFSCSLGLKYVIHFLSTLVLSVFVAIVINKLIIWPIQDRLKSYICIRIRENR